MKTCCGTRLPEGQRHCGYCRTTIRLIRERLCVLCRAPVADSSRDEGRCAECRSRQIATSRATARLLVLAAKARYMRRLRAA